jgi:DNA-binding IclR family transcriptional regulator
VTALGRGLQILGCFSRERRQLGTSEIARLTGIPQPTVWRLCHTLRTLGYLAQDTSAERLRLGLPVLGLGYAVLAREDIGQLARPYMQEIAERFRAGVSLGVRDQDEIVYLQRCIGGSVVFAGWTIGSRVPMIESSMGWACLAALTPDARQNAFRRWVKTGDGRHADLARRCEAAILSFQSKGFIVAERSLHEDVNSVAVPIRCGDPLRSLALSCGGLADRVGRSVLDRIGDDLLRLAVLLEPAVGPAPGRPE